jgi:2-polyprenyl-3-methyl-5-hydroxy-6-metoxy-1,4-benzoquinol methylase
MGLFKDYVSQTRKPEGFLGKMMVNGMNGGHARMADWGMSHLKTITPTKIVDFGCGGGRNAGELLKKYPSAHVTAIDYFDGPWITAKEGYQILFDELFEIFVE